MGWLADLVARHATGFEIAVMAVMAAVIAWACLAREKAAGDGEDE